MEISYFKQLLETNNAITIFKDVLVFNDYELDIYNNNLNTEFRNKTFDDLLDCHVSPAGNKTVREIVESSNQFYNAYSGGRGSSSISSGPMGGGFGHASGDEKGKLTSVKYASEFNVGGRFQHYDDMLSLFNKKYASADHEYGIVVNSEGFVTSHIEGGKSSVRIGGGAGDMVIHNHPSAGNFSDTDLISTASTQEKGIVATGTKYTYTMTKNKNFNAKAFIKAVKKAQWPTKYDYDKGSDWWLKKNAKSLGYTYSRVKTVLN